MAPRIVFGLWVILCLTFVSAALPTVERPCTVSPSLTGSRLEVSLGPQVLSHGGDTTWVQVHTDSTFCPDDPHLGHGGEGTGGPGPMETWCFEGGIGDTCGTNPPWDTKCFNHVDVRTHPSIIGINYWHIDTYRADQRTYCGDYALWCGSDSVWDGVPVECGTWADTPGYGNQWDCHVQLTLPDTFDVANGCTLFFDPRYDLECKYDYFYIDVWNDSVWVTLAMFNASSNNPGGTCGDPTLPNPDYWGNTDVGQPSSADWQDRTTPDLPAFYRVISPDTLRVQSGPRFRWRVDTDGSWSDADGRGNTDGAAFIDNVWVRGDSETYVEDFESGILDLTYWSLPDPDGKKDLWHLTHDPDPPYEGGDGGERGGCSQDSSYVFRGRPDGGFPAGAAWRNQWFTRLMSPRVPIQNSGCVVQYDTYTCMPDYTCDYADVVVRVYDSDYGRWCPWTDVYPYHLFYDGCFFWHFNATDDLSYFYDGSGDSIQFGWDWVDYSQSWYSCYGKHNKSDFQVDNVSIGFFDADATLFSSRIIDLLHDTFLTELCGYNSLFDAYDSDTVDYYRGPGAPPLRWDRQLRMDVSDKDGVSSVRLYGSQDKGATWTGKDMTKKTDHDPLQPQLGGEYYGTLCPSDFGDTAWTRGTEVWYYVTGEDALLNLEYYPARADPSHPQHTGEVEDYLEFTVLPKYPPGYTDPKIMLVDGYGRLNGDWAPCLEDLGNQVQLEKLYGQALTDAGYCYDTYDKSGAGSNVSLDPIRFAKFYDAVVWFAGPYLSNYLFDKEAQDSIKAYLGRGGKVVLCGDRIAYNMAPAWEGGVNEDSLGGEFLDGIMGCDYLEEMPSGFAYPYVYAVGMDSVDVFGTPVEVDLDTLLVYRECPYVKDMSYVATNPSPPVGYVAQPVMYVSNPTIGAEAVDEVIYSEYNGLGQCVFVNFDLCGSVNHEGTWCSGDASDPAPDFGAGTYEGRVDLIRFILEDLFGLPATGGGTAGVDRGTSYRWSLEQNVPNPFVSGTEIRYGVAQMTRVRLAVYNAIGQQVCVLVDKPVAAGVHRVRWDGCNEYGQPVASGVYFYKMAGGPFTSTRKLLLLR